MAEQQTYSQDQLKSMGYQIPSGEASVSPESYTGDQLKKVGFTSPTEYMPPPEKEFGVLDYLAGVAKPIASLPHFFGATTQAFGDLISKDGNPEGDSLGDRIMRQGIVMKENNDAWAKKTFPDNHNILNDVWQNISNLASLIGISKVLPKNPALMVAAAAMGVPATIDSYNEFRNRGDTNAAAIAKAGAIGLGNSLPALWTFNAFENQEGSILTKTLKNMATAAVGGGAQSISAGAIGYATGLHTYSGMDSFTDLLAQGVHDAAVWSVLGGVHGGIAAIQNHNASVKALVDTGMGAKEAEAKITEMETKATGEVMRWTEDQVGMTPEQRSRILTKRPDVMAKIIDVQGKMSRGEKLDPLDYDFIPRPDEPVPGMDKLQQQKNELEEHKQNIDDLQKAIAGNSEHQEFNAKIAEEGKVAEDEVNAKHDAIQKDLEVKNEAEQNRIEAEHVLTMKKLESVQEVKESELEKVKTKLDKAHTDAIIEDNKNYEKTGSPLPVSPKFQKLQDQIKDLQAKHDTLRQDLKESQVDRTNAKQDRANALAEQARNHESKMDAADKAREAELKDKLQNTPTLQAARTELERLKAEAETMKQKIEESKKALQPKGTQLTQVKRELEAVARGNRKGRQNTLANAKEVQATLSKMIRDKDTGLTESKDFKKFDTLIRKTLTQEDLKEALPQMKTMIRQLNERAAQLKMRDDLKKVNLDKLPVGYQDALKPILDSLDLHFRTGKDIKAKAATLNFFEKIWPTLNPNGEMTWGQQEALKAARMESITEMGHEKFTQLYQAIMQTITEGKRVNQLIAQETQKNFNTYRDQGLQRMVKMTRGKLVIEPNTAKIDARKINRTIPERIWDGAKWWGKAQIVDEEKIRRIGADELFQAAHEGNQQRKEQDRLDEATIKGFFSALKVPEMLTKPIPKEFESDVFKGKDALTLNAYMKIYAQSMNENGLRHLIGDPEEGTPGSGFTQDTIDDIQEWLEKDYPEATKAVQKMFDYFAPGSSAFARLEAAVVKYEGHRITVEDNYDPLQRLVNVPHNDFAWGNTGNYGRAVPNSGFVNPRVASSLALKDFNYLGDIFTHIRDVNAYIHLNGPLRDLQKYIDDPLIRQVAQAVHGDQLIPSVQKWINDCAFNGHQLDGPASKLYSEFRQKFSFAQIGFNAMSALKEVGQFAPSATEVGWGWQSRALIQHAFDMVGTDKFIDSKSLMMKNQGVGGEQIFGEMARQGPEVFGPPGLSQNIRQTGLWMHQVVYRMVSRATWLGAYNRFMVKAQQGEYDPVEADKYAVQFADQMTRATHPVMGDMYTPEAFRQGDLGRTLGMFHTAITQNMNLYAKDFQQVKEGNMSIAEAVTKGITRSLFTALIIGTISERRTLQKDELPAYMLDVSLGSDVLYGMFTHAYVTGHWEGINNPASEAFGALYGIFSDKTSEKRRTDIAEAASDFTGLPFGVLYREISGHQFQAHPDRR